MDWNKLKYNEQLALCAKYFKHKDLTQLTNSNIFFIILKESEDET